MSAIEVVDRAYHGYWSQRGWDPSADVRTLSAIDTVISSLGNANRIRSEDAPVVIGGYVFAVRGISRVELNIDDSGWQSVQLKKTGSNITWRPWRYAWRASPGDHVVTVRATDGGGVLQSNESLPAPPLRR